IVLMRLVRVVATILVLLLATYALWTVYENTLTPATLDHGAAANIKPSPRGVLSPTAARALKAYGGEAIWKDATTVESTVTVGGLLLQLKGAGIPPHAKITVDIRRPHTVIDPVDESGDIGVLDGFSVSIVSPGGVVLEQRADAREHLQNATISTKWDRLNLVYFLGYAFWGYYSLPYQLMRSDIEWTELHRSEEHTSELQSQSNLVCRLLLEKKNAQGCDVHTDEVAETHAPPAGGPNSAWPSLSLCALIRHGECPQAGSVQTRNK